MCVCVCVHTYIFFACEVTRLTNMNANVTVELINYERRFGIQKCILF